MLNLFAAASLALLQQLDQSTVLAHGEVAEPCIAMQPGDRLEFDFKASASVDFNLHYHSDSGVDFPVDVKSVRSKEAVYTAPFEQTYCLMWTNRGSAKIELQYHYRVSRPES
mgnify:CR=1 FL=1